MIFRNSQGKLVNIKKYDYANDKSFYKKIISIKFPICDNIEEKPSYSTEIIKRFLK